MSEELQGPARDAAMVELGGWVAGHCPVSPNFSVVLVDTPEVRLMVPPAIGMFMPAEEAPIEPTFFPEDKARLEEVNLCDGKRMISARICYDWRRNVLYIMQPSVRMVPNSNV